MLLGFDRDFFVEKAFQSIKECIQYHNNHCYNTSSQIKNQRYHDVSDEETGRRNVIAVYKCYLYITSYIRNIYIYIYTHNRNHDDTKHAHTTQTHTHTHTHTHTQQQQQHSSLLFSCWLNTVIIVTDYFYKKGQRRSKVRF
jgi:hypothetical protein